MYNLYSNRGRSEARRRNATETWPSTRSQVWIEANRDADPARVPSGRRSTRVRSSSRPKYDSRVTVNSDWDWENRHTTPYRNSRNLDLHGGRAIDGCVGLEYRDVCLPPERHQYNFGSAVKVNLVRAQHVHGPPPAAAYLREEKSPDSPLRRAGGGGASIYCEGNEMTYNNTRERSDRRERDRNGYYIDDGPTGASGCSGGKAWHESIGKKRSDGRGEKNRGTSRNCSRDRGRRRGEGTDRPRDGDRARSRRRSRTRDSRGRDSRGRDHDRTRDHNTSQQNASAQRRRGGRGQRGGRGARNLHPQPPRDQNDARQHGGPGEINRQVPAGEAGVIIRPKDPTRGVNKAMGGENNSVCSTTGSTIMVLKPNNRSTAPSSNNDVNGGSHGSTFGGATSPRSCTLGVCGRSVGRQPIGRRLRGHVLGLQPKVARHHLDDFFDRCGITGGELDKVYKEVEEMSNNEIVRVFAEGNIENARNPTAVCIARMRKARKVEEQGKPMPRVEWLLFEQNVEPLQAVNNFPCMDSTERYCKKHRLEEVVEQSLNAMPDGILEWLGTRKDWLAGEDPLAQLETYASKTNFVKECEVHAFFRDHCAHFDEEDVVSMGPAADESSMPHVQDQEPVREENGGGKQLEGQTSEVATVAAASSGSGAGGISGVAGTDDNGNGGNHSSCESVYASEHQQLESTASNCGAGMTSSCSAGESEQEGDAMPVDAAMTAFAASSGTDNEEQGKLVANDQNKLNADPIEGSAAGAAAVSPLGVAAVSKAGGVSPSRLNNPFLVADTPIEMDIDIMEGAAPVVADVVDKSGEGGGEKMADAAQSSRASSKDLSQNPSPRSEAPSNPSSAGAASAGGASSSGSAQKPSSVAAPPRLPRGKSKSRRIPLRTQFFRANFQKQLALATGWNAQTPMSRDQIEEFLAVEFASIEDYIARHHLDPASEAAEGLRVAVDEVQKQILQEGLLLPAILLEEAAGAGNREDGLAEVSGLVGSESAAGPGCLRGTESSGHDPSAGTGEAEPMQGVEVASSSSAGAHHQEPTDSTTTASSHEAGAAGTGGQPVTTGSSSASSSSSSAQLRRGAKVLSPGTLKAAESLLLGRLLQVAQILDRKRQLTDGKKIYANTFYAGLRSDGTSGVGLGSVVGTTSNGNKKPHNASESEKDGGPASVNGSPQQGPIGGSAANNVLSGGATCGGKSNNKAAAGAGGGTMGGGPSLHWDRVVAHPDVGSDPVSCERFLNENGVDAVAKELFWECNEYERGQVILIGSLQNQGNPSAVLMGRLGKATGRGRKIVDEYWDRKNPDPLTGGATAAAARQTAPKQEAVLREDKIDEELLEQIDDFCKVNRLTEAIRQRLIQSPDGTIEAITDGMEVDSSIPASENITKRLDALGRRLPHLAEVRVFLRDYTVDERATDMFLGCQDWQQREIILNAKTTDLTKMRNPSSWVVTAICQVRKRPRPDLRGRNFVTPCPQAAK